MEKVCNCNPIFHWINLSKYKVMRYIKEMYHFSYDRIQKVITKTFLVK